MKAVWIVCTVVCVCGLICSGGLIFMGRSLVKATTEANAAADDYALATVNSVCKEWAPDKLKAELDPSAGPGVVDSVLASAKTLGSLQNAGPFTASSTGVKTEGGSSITTVTVQDEATFAHGSAHLKLVVVYSNGIWKVLDFQITPTSASKRTDV